MHLRNFDLNLLVALDVLLSERHVTRAAERLNVTQPTMSNALQRIRDHFGDDILSRSGRNLKLTPLAEELAERVSALLQQASSIIDADWAFDPLTAAKRFRIVMSDYCAAVMMPQLVRRLSQVAPNVVCEVIPLTSGVLDDLSAGRIDLCITAQDLEQASRCSGWDLLGRRDLFKDRWVCVTSAHRSDVGPMTLEQFCRLQHVVTHFGDGGLSIEELTLRELGIGIPIAVVVGTVGLLTAVLPGTNLVATVQEKLARVACRSGELTVHPSPVNMPELREVMIWHRRSDRDEAQTWFRALLVEVTASL